MKKISVRVWVTVLITALMVGMTCPGFGTEVAQAAVKDISLGADNGTTIEVNVGDTGKIVPYTSAAKVTFSSENTSILTITESGTYKAVGVGSATVMVLGKDSSGNMAYCQAYKVNVLPDLSEVAMNKSSITLYPTLGTSSAQITFVSDYALNQYDSRLKISMSSSNKKMSVNWTLYGNTLTISCSNEGSTTLTFKINDQTFTIQLTVVTVGLNATSVLLVKDKTKQLKVAGTDEKITWKSSNTNCVTVSSKGKLKGIKGGNAIITASYGDVKLGCVVSVVSAKRKKVIAAAEKVGQTCTYSQAKRMQDGYYDCSSLVWRAYSKYGCYLGSKNYAPTAADEASYLAKKKKLLSGGFSSKNVQKLKIKAGNLLFETGSNNGRYKGIYHVEMITGYCFNGFDENGKAMVGIKWANRSDNYYRYGVGIVGQP